MKTIFNQTIALLLVCMGVLAACNEDVSVDSIYITAAEKTPITNFSAKKTDDALGITISSALIAKSDIEGQLLIEKGLVASYNSAHGEDYQSLPDGACVLSNSHVKIKNGNYRSEAVKLVVKDINALLNPEVKQAEFVISSTVGEQVMKATVTPDKNNVATLDLAKLHPGTYKLTVHTNKGKYTQMFIKR